MKSNQRKLKETELRIVVELMKNSRKSDREIAKAVGLSQPTVSRTIEKLRKEGVIKEFTIIPDFRLLGYNILGASRLNVSEDNEDMLQKVRTDALRMEKENPNAFLMAVNGTGGDKNRLFIALYEKYSDYADAIKVVRGAHFVDVNSVDTFVADLNDETSMRMLSMASVANHILYRLKKQENPVQQPKD